MALDLSVRYPGQVETGDPGYPTGKAQNIAVEADGSGTPFEKDLVNDQLGFQQALLAEAGITPSGVPDKVGASQYLEAVKAVANGALILHRGAQEWQAQSIWAAPSLSDFLFLAAPIQSTLFLGAARQGLVAIGAHDSTTSVYLRSQDGTIWDDRDQIAFDLVSGDGLSVPVCVAAAAPAEWLVGVNQAGSGLVRRASSWGVGSNDHTPPDSINVTCVGYALGKYLVALVDGTIESSATFTSGWTVAGPLATSFPAATYGAPAGEIATDGTGHVILCASSVIAGVARFRIWHSTNTTAWALAMTGDASLTFMNVSWSSAHTKFFALASNGKLFSSPDGLTWTLQYTTAITATNEATARHGTFAIAGNCIAKVMSRNLGGDSKYPGIYYTMDAGATWHASAFAKGFGDTSTDSTIAPRELHSLIEANGRFYATDGIRIFRSGLLAAPTVPVFTS